MIFVMKTYWLYILCSQKHGTLYVGITSDLPRRIFEHKNHLIPHCFTSRYNVTQLVYVEQHVIFDQAVKRETRIKEWPRQWKINLIEKNNPDWLEIALL